MMKSNKRHHKNENNSIIDFTDTLRSLQPQQPKTHSCRKRHSTDEYKSESTPNGY